MLDRFTQRDIEDWQRASADLDALHETVYLATEPDRKRMRADLIDAINVKPATTLSFDGWHRLFDYRWANTPLSSAGSLRSIGGRFNVGSDIELSLIDPFPALYIADSFETAYRERYQRSSDEDAIGGLTAEELSLGVSTCSIRINGHIERVLDVTDPVALGPLCRLLGKVRMPAEATRLMKRLRMKPDAIRMVKTPRQLQQAIMERNWRTWPVQFDVPSPSQWLADLAIEAGYEAIRYRSSKTCTGQCLAVFPAHLASNASFVELADPCPPEVLHQRLDLDSAENLAGWEYAPRTLLRRRP